MQISYNGLKLPKNGKPIEYANGQFEVPDHPILPFIEGDGTGRDIWKASQRVFNAAVEKAYGGQRAIRWFEIFAGERPFASSATGSGRFGGRRARPESFHQGSAHHAGRRRYSLAQRGLRQMLDLYACVRPVKYYQGVPSR